ncbi:MAG: hypothetical protein K0U37_06935 [Gammaproteobacteria bacterium]|nr:hypothetical protein [Gammaproteobacteria bacterium]
MSTGNFTEFTVALAAFESGIDTTQPQTQASLQYLRVFDSQYGNVDPATVDFNSPSDLADLQYHVHNTLGFMGKYQFGEPLLIDLGYYVPAPSGYYGTTATNEWQGEWTGKNGVHSKEDFMSEVQELAIREAFSMNMGVIDQYLGQAGKTIDDFIGQEFAYTRLGEEHVATVTMSGILASAHLQGPGGVSQLLLNNVASSDEYGTNILFYMDKFGGYNSPFGTDANDHLMGSDYSETFAGEAGDNIITTGDGEDKIIIANRADGHDTITDFDVTKDVISLSDFPGVTVENLNISDANGNSVVEFPNGQTLTLAGVSAVDLSASQFVYGPYSLGWSANSGDTIIDNFNVKHDLIDLNYAFASNNLNIYEEQGSSVIEVVGNHQRVILEGIPVDELSSAQFVKAPVDFATVHFGVDTDYTPPVDTSSGDETTAPPVDGGNTSGNTQQGTGAGDSFSYTWNWGANDVISQFDASEDQVDLKNFWASFDEINLYDDAAGNAVIDLTGLNNQTVTLENVSVADLSADNFTGVSGDWQSVSGSAPVDDGGIDDNVTTEPPVVDDTPVDTTPPPDDGANTDGHEYSYTWNWGANEVVDNFDVQQDALNLKSFWASYDEFEISDNVNGDAVIDLSALNSQTITLQGVSSATLSADNFVGVAGAFAGAGDTSVVTPPANDGTTIDPGGQDAADNTFDTIEHDVNETNLVSTDNVHDTFNFTWNWGSNKTIVGFDATQDTVDLTRFWTNSDQVDIHDNANGDAVIDLTNLNNQTITLLGVSSSELGDGNLVI